jgi:hypothetical protein
MNSRHFKIFLFLCIIFHINNNLCGQDSNKLKKYPLQFGISSGADNSQHSDYIQSNLALHLFSGFTGAVNGFQISGVSNRTHYFITGFQISAFSNVTGHLNFKNEHPDEPVLEGAQISLLLNKSEGSAKGLQLALYNRVTRTFIGAQSGMFNIIQKGGIGIQLGGIFNIAFKNNSLFQLGLFNYSRTAGLRRADKDYFKRDHLQIGLVNKTYQNNGIQIGLINLSKKNEGIPIGLINTNTSHFSVAVAGNELINTYLRAGFGSKHILNRISIGYNYAWNTLYSGSGSYGLEFRVFPPGEDPTLLVYHDLIYLLRKDFSASRGHFVSRSGLSIRKSIFNGKLPLLLGIAYNIGYFNKPDNFSVPFLLVHDKNSTTWLGFDIGIRL